MENEFLDEFQDFLLKLPKDQTGNFCDQIDTMLIRPDIYFLHLACRKIDIKKSLYTSLRRKTRFVAFEYVATQCKLLSKNRLHFSLFSVV